MKRKIFKDNLCPVAKKYCVLSLMKYAMYVLWSRKYELKCGTTITQKL